MISDTDFLHHRSENRRKTHVSCVPKKKTWYLFEGDLTAPSGNSSICERRAQRLEQPKHVQNRAPPQNRTRDHSDMNVKQL